jgi:adenine-specific DNA-methyltransferase
MKVPKGRLEITWMGKDLALIPSENGKYDYEWVDRSDPRACEVKSIEVTETIGALQGDNGAKENLMIVGDCGDALRSLGTIPELADKYLGKVKLIYIDPPFNTDQAFEHYADALEHSVWLTMMRDRIKDIKPLMAEDASIWVHLDDSEVHRMRMVLDEELGADKFVATIVWQKKYSRDNRPAIGAVHDYILVYATQGAARWKATRNRIPRVNATQYRNPNRNPDGSWRPIPLDVQGGHATKSQFYDVVTPSGKVVRPANGRAWSVTEPVMQEMIAHGEVYFGLKGDGMPNTVRYLKDDEGLVPWTWWPHEEVGNNDDAKKEIIKLFGDKNVFDTPKPERLIERIIHIGSNPGDLVLDCFAGSGTTAAVAHKLGRRWVTIELMSSTVETFTKNRMVQVVGGSDATGLSVRECQSFVDEKLNGHVKLADARIALRVFSSVIKNTVLDAIDKDTAAALQKELKIRLGRESEDNAVLTGGGFTVARIGPSMYEVDDDDGSTVYLSAAATNGEFSKAIAGQLKYRLTSDHGVFCGVKGRSRLAVIDGVADENVVRTVVSSLADRERAVIVAKAVLSEATELLGSLSPGSRIRKVPNEVFPKATVK